MRPLLATASLVLLVGCPGPPPDGGTGSGGTTGGEVPTSAAELPWPETPVSELARRETMAALEAVSAPPRPVAFLVRLDVGYVDEGPDASNASIRWVRFGVVLAGSGLHVFDARPIAVTDAGYGEPLGGQPLAPLARALGEVELLAPDACESLGDGAVCEPLLALVADATEPAALVGGAAPARLAPGDRALLGRGADGAPVVLDLTGPGAPRRTDITENAAQNPSP